MSRIGKLPINIPVGVTVTNEKGKVTVTGPKGTLEYTIRPEMTVDIKDAVLTVEPRLEIKRTGAFHGLTRALIANMITGVTQGFEKKLELVGVGYRAKQEGPSKISMTLGFSHPVIVEAPKTVELVVEDNVTITIKGIDKQLVGLTASKIRKIRKPEPYKGKGIRYHGEAVRRKQGKSGKV